MSIRWKVAIIIAAIFLALEGVNLGVQRFIMLPGFLSLEKEEAIKDAKRVEEAISREIKYLDALAHDWAAWDDTYEFAVAPDDGYIRANLSPSVFKDNKLNAICIYAADGRLIWRGVDYRPGGPRHDLTPVFKEKLPVTHPLVSYAEENRPLFDVYRAGICMTENGPLVVSSRPILTSDNEGPVRGYLILAYFIDEGFVDRIVRQTHVDFGLFPIGDSTVPGDIQGGMAINPNDKTYLIDEGKNVPVLKIYTTVPDIAGENALVIEGRIERKLMAKGCITMRYAMISLIIAGGLALVVTMLLIQGVIIKPIGKLTASIAFLKREKYESKPVFSGRLDEIGFLEREFENLMTQLQYRSRRLEELNAILLEDIDRRKQAEDALRESEERFKTLLENLPVGVFVHDINEKILLVNDVACENTGYSREELLKKSLRDINPNTISGEEHARLWRGLCEGRPVAVESVNIRKDGSRYPVEAHLTRIALDGNTIVLALVFDITERKQAEEALRASEEKLARSKKMESLGLLAGGVAHDLNNVLSGIVSYPELILMDLPKDSKLVNPLKTMQTSGKRAVAIVQDLLTVARGVAVEKHPLNLNLVVSRYMESAEHRGLIQYHGGVTVRTELDSQLMNIKGASVHIGKSLMNLVSNAAEALEENGEIIIKTENRYLDRPRKGYEEATIGEYAVLTVKDNGPGILPENLERIFEPFYTKKVMGRSGTGLGLAIVWNVLQEHRGYIDVASDANGTIFELYFPITREEIEKDDSSLSIQDYSGGGEKILVVDDVESQREIFSRMLEMIGYRPVAVSCGEKAVEYLKEHTVDLVILDMIMDPGINGRETYERILKLHPAQKAIIASGFAETDDVRQTQRLGAGWYIKKPVQLENLGLAIKDALI